MTGSGPCRTERVRRQEYDLGDPGDTVYYSVKDVSYGGSWPTGWCYHEEDCYRLNGCAATTDVTRGKAMERWLAPCPDCITNGVP